jgi:manganese efflux pump family protein
MDIINTLLISFALGIDAFSVALGTGAFLVKTTKRQKFRLSFHFGLFQFLMPIIGWFLGSSVYNYVKDYDHWVVLILLSVIGLKMIYDSFKVDTEKIKTDVTKGFSLLILSIATSIDALAVGFSYALIKQSIFLPSIIIGVIAAAMTLTGIYIGEKFSAKFERTAAFVGGLVLIAIGVRVVIEHCLS